jgi:hypothetical protein
MSSEIQRRLASLLSRDIPLPDPATRRALEDRLVARLPAPAPRGFLSAHRFALAGLAAAIAVVGACRLPADYPLDVGERVAIVLDDERAAEIDPQLIARHVETTWPIERLEVAVAVEEDDAGHRATRIQLDAVGDVTADEMWEDLVETFPVLDGARMEPEDLEVMVHGTVGGRLSHEVLDVVIDVESAEQARADILEQLAAQGLEGDADVSVTDHPDGRREVRIEVRAEKREP